MLHPDGDTVTVPTANGLKGEFGIYDHHVFKMSSFQPFAACFWGKKKKKKSYFYLLSVFPLLPVSTHLLSVCDTYRYIWVCMEIYIPYILYAEICFYSLYNMCSHIIYTVCKRKFCPSVISQLEICGNEFACVCLSPLPPAQGMATTQKRSRMHQVLVHLAKDDQRFIIPR